MSDINNYLFDYIKNMIYYPAKAQLDVDRLPDDYKKLGIAIKSMCEWSQEANEFAGKIAKGYLDTEDIPPVDNGFASNVKALQSTLLHMTWQTKQIAKGDYNQKMLYMGELSEAFNAMASQLKERTEELNAEKDLLRYFLETSNECIIVMSMENDTVLYTNSVADNVMECLKEDNRFRMLNKKSMVSEELNQREWRLDLSKNKDSEQIYRVYSVLTTWRGKKAIAHMAEDITGQEVEKSVLTDMALRDPLTNMYNRRFALIRLSNMLTYDEAFSLAFVDIDYLKYCNDEFGHNEGDEYIIQVSEGLKKIAGDDIVVRSGGDEFIMICTKMMAAELVNKLNRFRENLRKEHVGAGKCIKKSFSYGVVERVPGDEQDVYKILEEADSKMYEYKRHNKQKNEEYQDARIVEKE